MAERTEFPLCWPEGWKRAKTRVHAAFNKTREPKYVQDGQGRTVQQYQGKTRLSVADAVRRVLDGSSSLDEISRVIDLTDRLA